MRYIIRFLASVGAAALIMLGLDFASGIVRGFQAAPAVVAPVGLRT